MIQFQCPHCQATIRVSDSAMGQRGSCPQCKQILLVPMIDPSAQQSASNPEQSGSTLSNSEQSAQDIFSAISSSDNSSQGDPIYRASQKKRQSGVGSLLTGLFFLLIGAAVAVTFYYMSQPVMQGKLSAQLMPANSIKPTLLSRQAIDQPDLFEKFWLKNPSTKIEINSRLLETSVLAQQKGLEFQLFPGQDHDLYRVDVLKNKTFYEYYSKHSEEFEALRQEILTSATTDFLKQMIKREIGLNQNSNLMIEFRDRMILSVLTKSLGFRLCAEVDRKQYPCVWQDKDDRLYFSLPAGTIKFTIRETIIPNQKKLYPDSLRFTVSCPEAKKRKKDFQDGHLLSKEHPKEEDDLEEKANDNIPDEKENSEAKEQ